MCQQFGKKVQSAILLTVLFQMITTSESFSVQSSGRSIPIHSQTVSPFSAPTLASVAATFHQRSVCSNNQSHNKKSLSPLFNSPDGKNDKAEELEEDQLPTYGGFFGVLTGLSLTAIRQSIRTTTGLSLTATRTTLRTLTGVSVTAAMKNLFGIFPPWFRYFLQPLFIMYYTPLMLVKYFIGSTKGAKKEAYKSHEKIVEAWKEAIRAAEVAQEFLPLHVTDDGTIESLTPQSVPVADAIIESLNIASTVQNNDDKM